MECLYCGSETNIINSRRVAKSNQTWRRHHCQKCKITFTTLENCQLDNTLLVETSKNNRQPFCRDKLFLSIYQAVNYSGNDAVNTANHLTQTIVNALLKPKPLAPLISAKDIYLTAVSILKRYDAVAAIRYASVRASMPTINDVKRFLRN
jgi:transcriptional repressor NrdR